MKKIIAASVGLMLAGGVAATTASAAVESQFGGYWRTRFTFEDNFTGQDTSSKFYVDQRTRLYFTAKFSDDFKFVNKFEFNSSWGDTTKSQTAKVQTGTTVDKDGKTVPVYTNYDVSSVGLGAGGDLGADGKGNFRIKNSYADFNMGANVNAKVGILPATIARGFIFDDDASGAVLTMKFGNVAVPLVYLDTADTKAQPWDQSTSAKLDQRIYAVLAAVPINDDFKVTPYFVYNTDSGAPTASLLDSVKNWYLGADLDMKFGPAKVWLTGIYEGGTVDSTTGKSWDIGAYLGAAGAEAAISPMVTLRTQAFYASGDDNANDDKIDAFISAPGTVTLNSNGFAVSALSPNVGSSYYWAEIMGYGIFDNATSNGSPEDDITNIWAGNLGVTLKPIDKLTVYGDIWYASLVKANTNGDKALGTEVDLRLSYAIYDNLNADFVFAYLFSGDATGPENVMESGLQLSLKF